MLHNSRKHHSHKHSMSFPQAVRGMLIILYSMGTVSPGAVHCRWDVCVCVCSPTYNLLVRTAFFFSLDTIKPVIINIDSDNWTSLQLEKESLYKAFFAINNQLTYLKSTVISLPFPLQSNEFREWLQYTNIYINHCRKA